MSLYIYTRVSTMILIRICELSSQLFTLVYGLLTCPNFLILLDSFPHGLLARFLCRFSAWILYCHPPPQPYTWGLGLKKKVTGRQSITTISKSAYATMYCRSIVCQLKELVCHQLCQPFECSQLQRGNESEDGKWTLKVSIAICHKPLCWGSLVERT